MGRRTLFSGLGNVLYQKYRRFWGLFQKPKLSPIDIQVLERYFPYYRGLSAFHQKEFRHRVAFFITLKQFIPRGGLAYVTREMVILMSATAVMVAFGFDSVSYLHFNKILVYPDNYYSTITKKYHQGEVNPKLGIIVVSWSNFVQGLGIGHDGVNLGIHEMAHALKLENLIHYNNESDFFNPTAWKRFEHLAKMEITKIKAGEGSVFRESASANMHEFFAVALEMFFEKAKELKATRPNIYETLSVLLRQYPLKMLQNE